MAKDIPFISVIVPNNNRPSLSETIGSILANHLPPPFEIIVTGETEEKLRVKDERLRYLDHSGLPTGALRNLAAEEARGELLLFTDSDCVTDRTWMQNAARAVNAARPIVGGGLRFPESNKWDLGDNLAVFHACHVTQREGPAPAHLGTNNLAVQRAVFKEVGGFRNDLTVGEDWEFLNRARAQGHPIYFNPSFAVLHNSGRITPALVRQHAQWYGRGYVSLLTCGHLGTQKLRLDRWLGRIPFAATLWSALKALNQTIRLIAHPPFWRYARAFPAVWLFYFTRRREVFRGLLAGK